MTIRTLALAGALAAGATHAQEITVGLQLEPPHLDPTSAAAGAIDQVTYANIFEGLTRFAEDGSVVPGLAESWDVSEDGRTYTFHLREGVTFHDGTSMDAEDVVFSLDRARAEDSVNAQKGLFEGIESVEAVDPLDRARHARRARRQLPLQDGLGRRGDRGARVDRRHQAGARRHRRVPPR